jgi:two-component system chemotaxis response regulator CheB
MTQSLFPDLILLDVNMPVMDGSTALKHIMIRTPCPVVVMSNVGSGSPEAVLQFLDLGAVDFMAKPVKNKDLLLQQQKIVTRIIQAATADIKNSRRYRSAPGRNPEHVTGPALASPSDQLVVISTGCSAHGELTQVLAQLPDDHNLAVVVLQSIPPAFIPALARHLDTQSPFKVVPLTDGAPLRTGICYLGTPGHALRTMSTGREMVVEMPTHRKDSRHEVSYLDLFLCSAVDGYPGSLMVVVLSGAETGNLEGLRYVQARGARIVVQDPATCMMAGPPASVVAAGLAETTASPETIADHIRAWAGNGTFE